MSFVKAGDTTLQLSPLSLGQQEELAEYLRYSYFEEAKQQITGLPTALAEYVLKNAKAKADTIYPGRTEHGTQFYTSKGLAYCLHLATKKHKDISLADAYGYLDTIDKDGIDSVAEAAGFKIGVSNTPATDEALPLKELIHSLVNGPQGYTIEEAKALSLGDVELIYCDPKAPQPVYTQADQQAHLDRVAEKQSKKRLGIWGTEDIWQA